MTTPKSAPLVLLFAAVVLSFVVITTRRLPASIRRLRFPTPAVAVDPSCLSQVARAQAATALAQPPGPAVAALLGF